MSSTIGKKEGAVAWSALQAVVVTFVAFSLSIIFTSIAGYLAIKVGLSDTIQTFVLYTTNTLCLMLVSAIFINQRKVKFKDFFKLPKYYVTLNLLPLYYVIYSLISVYINQLLILIPSYNANQAQPVGYNSVSGLGLVLAFISLVVLTPLGEEILFRGVLYQGLKTKLNVILAAIVTSLLFGLAHAQWNVGVDTFVLSLAAIYLYEKYQSLWFPIGLHAIKNFIAFIMIFVFLQ